MNYLLLSASLVSGLACFLLTAYHFERMRENINPDRRWLVNFTAPLWPILPGFLTKGGRFRRQRFLIYLAFSAALITPFLAMTMGHSHLLPILREHGVLQR